MPIRFKSYKKIVLVMWVLAIATIPIWSAIQNPKPGWDLQVYRNAVHALRIGHDPYADGIARQQSYHETGPHPVDDMPPYTYVYSLLTLPALRVAAQHPRIFSVGLYWLFYCAGALSMVWAGKQAADEGELPFVAFVAPAAVYFPCLLQSSVILSGNVAYVLYGLVLTAAILGWKCGRWAVFYIAVFLAACCKAPMLTLLAIPVLSARRQWLPAGATAAAALALFGLQPILWPSQFGHYLQAVELQFSYNHDFGVSPAGLFGNTLDAFHLPYSPASGVLYVTYALAVCLVLFRLSTYFHAGRITLEQWMPLILVGTVLLNPRIKEYDVAAITMPLAIILWRLCALSATPLEQAWKALAMLLGCNWIVATAGDGVWEPTACLLLLGLFAGGAWEATRLLPEPHQIKQVMSPQREMAY